MNTASITRTLWSARITRLRAERHSIRNTSQRERVRTQTGHLRRTRDVQLARNTGWSKERELKGRGATIIVVGVTLHQREREGRSQGEGLQVVKLHRTKRTREMRLARKYMEAVSVANKRPLESHVRRKRSCVVWGAAERNTGHAVRLPPTPLNVR